MQRSMANNIHCNRHCSKKKEGGGKKPVFNFQTVQVILYDFITLEFFFVSVIANIDALVPAMAAGFLGLSVNEGEVKRICQLLEGRSNTGVQREVARALGNVAEKGSQLTFFILRLN